MRAHNIKLNPLFLIFLKSNQMEFCVKYNYNFDDFKFPNFTRKYESRFLFGLIQMYFLNKNKENILKLKFTVLFIVY